MKTTIELPDDLMVEVKIAAARRRCTLRQFFEAALRREAQAAARRIQSKRPFKWHTYPGGFAPGFDVANREHIYTWLDKEFDRF